MFDMSRIGSRDSLAIFLAVSVPYPYTAFALRFLKQHLLMFAIVDIAGFQEKVSEGDALRVPLLKAKEGDSMTFDSVLLVSKSDSDVTIGTPTVSGASVEVKVVGHGKGDKIRVFKMKRRKRYRRVHGHRQDYTDIEVTKIKAAGGAKKAPAAKKTEEKVEKEVEAKED